MSTNPTISIAGKDSLKVQITIFIHFNRSLVVKYYIIIDIPLFQNSGTGSLGVAVAGGAFLSFFTFATPLLIHYVSKKYVTELLYNKIEDRYTAITYSLLLQKKKVGLLRMKDAGCFDRFNEFKKLRDTRIIFLVV